MTSPTPSYFAVFNLEPRLVLDVDKLRAQFLELSRKYHPDFHATADASEKDESLRQTALVNNAYKTLRDPQRRAEYLIELHGNGIESNKNAIPPTLLEEVFDIQEAGEELREARLSGDEVQLSAAEKRVVPLRKQASAARETLAAELQTLFTDFDAAADSHSVEAAASQALLRKIRLVLDQMNYLRTVLRNLK